MKLNVTCLAALKNLAKIKFNKETGKFRNLSEAREALCKDLGYRNYKHAKSVLPELLKKPEAPKGSLEGKVWCYAFCGASAEIDGKRLMVPSIVVKDESGHRPLMGGSPETLPYFWGESLKEIREACERANEDLGLSSSEAMEIVASSIRTHHKDKRSRLSSEADKIVQVLNRLYPNAPVPFRLATESETEADSTYGEFTILGEPGPFNWGIDVASSIMWEKYAIMHREGKLPAPQGYSDFSKVMGESRRKLFEETLEKPLFFNPPEWLLVETAYGNDLMLSDEE